MDSVRQLGGGKVLNIIQYMLLVDSYVSGLLEVLISHRLYKLFKFSIYNVNVLHLLPINFKLNPLIFFNKDFSHSIPIFRPNLDLLN